MEINNFPDRIYLPRDAEYPQSPDIWWEREPDESNVEYIRADTFIEKAWEYLEPILTEYAGFYVGGDILQHFKNYMKGK